MARDQSAVTGMKANIPHSSPWITADDIAAVCAELRSCQIAKGAAAQKFELAVAKYLGFSNAWSLGTGQAGLVSALRAVGARQGQKVLMPTYVCRAVADAVKEIGATPVFCDVDEDWCLSSDTVAPWISVDVAAIVAVHPFGIAADVKPLMQFGIPVVEDCCQCFVPHVGHTGDVAVFSFHATKCLTTGEGGMVATSDPEIAERIQMQQSVVPNSSRMSDLQAALGLTQLARYDEMLCWRRTEAESYAAAAESNIKRLIGVWDRSIFFRFPLTIEEGYECTAQRFEESGINVRRGVDTLLHRQAGLSDKAYPIATNLFNTTLSVPFYPALNQDQSQTVKRAITELLK